MAPCSEKLNWIFLFRRENKNIFILTDPTTELRGTWSCSGLYLSRTNLQDITVIDVVGMLSDDR